MPLLGSLPATITIPTRSLLLFPAATTAAMMLLLLRRRRCSNRGATTLLCEPCEPAEGEAKEAGAAQPPPEALSPSSSPAVRATPRRALVGSGSPREIGLSKDVTATTRRENYIDWHDYFMSVAMLSAYRSKDPSKQVGACIVDPKRQRIVGIGYNGFPWGCSDDELPWARKGASVLETKHPYVCHAEMNAIFNKNSASLEGCRIYTTLFPCNECTKMIIQSRLSDVVYLSDEKHQEPSMVASRRMLGLAGIPYWAHKPAAPRIVIDFDSELAR